MSVCVCSCVCVCVCVCVFVCVCVCVCVCRVKMCSDDLKNHLEGMIDAVFGPVEKRWIDAYFPFTGLFCVCIRSLLCL